MNWKNYVEKQNERTFVLPEGWDARATVAAQLDCSEDGVDKALHSSLKSGEVEKQQFRVWAPALKRIVIVVAYRKRQCTEASNAPAKRPPDGWWTAERIAQARALKATGKSWIQVGAVMGKSGDGVRLAVARAR